MTRINLTILEITVSCEMQNSDTFYTYSFDEVGPEGNRDGVVE